MITKPELETLSHEELLETAKQLSKACRHLSKTNRRLQRKLRLKTRTLWISTGYIADSKIMPKTQEEIYTLLKMVAQQELDKEDAENLNKNSEDISENN